MTQASTGQIDDASWRRHPDSPVLKSGNSGEWDEEHLAPSSVFLLDGTYHLFYAGSDGSAWRIGIATSTDLTNWTKHPANPVLDVGDPGAWDDQIVHEPVVTKIDDTYHMIYRGQDGKVDQFGHATSADLIDWTRNEQNPVLGVGEPGAWDDTHIFGGELLRENGDYYLFYTGYSEPNVWPRSPLATIKSIYRSVFLNEQPSYRIGIANSIDLGSWTKDSSNPVFEPSDSKSWDSVDVSRPSIIRIADHYYLFYDGRGQGDHQIGYATSEDLLSWNRGSKNPVLEPGETGRWDSRDVRSPVAIQSDDKIFLLYRGDDGDTQQIGLAHARIGSR